MDIKNLISLMPTQYRQQSDTDPLRSGHAVQKLGTWSMENGFEKTQSLSYEHDSYTQALGCPVVAVISEKFGKENITVDISGKTAKKYKIDGTVQTIEREQGDRTISYELYEATNTTESVSLTIPRFTRRKATFVLSGLGTNIYEIESASTDFATYNVKGEITFYALASNGSKIVYWMSIHKLAQMLKTVLMPWIQPEQCLRCDGSGVEPNTEEENCNRCGGYGYAGFHSIKYVQQRQGYDVGLRRENIPDWENMSDSEYRQIRKFINKCWTQRWWVTPTKDEIKRLFAHFYNVDKSEIIIEERFHEHEPIWYLDLPRSGSVESPFGRATDSDLRLMKYVARSVTPAGTSVFVGFYELKDFGNFDDFDTGIPRLGNIQAQSSMEHQYSVLGTARQDFFNGWTVCTENFEVENLSGTDFVFNNNYELVNGNDIGRHRLRLGNFSYAEITGSTIGSITQTGYMECWMHPGEGTHRFGLYDETNTQWFCYTEFKNSGFYDNNDNFLRNASKHNDYHVSMEFDATIDEYNIDINLEREGSEIAFANAGTIDSDSTFVFEVGSGTVNDKCYFDDFGCTFENGYTAGTNYRRLYPIKWGLNHSDELSGVTDLHRRYIRRDRPIIF